ncbi:MAG: LruC domain-containing protein [bacterium]|nr:LruC domain-containing protein [bacterium]
MKKLLIFSLVLGLGFSSCKKFKVDDTNNNYDGQLVTVNKMTEIKVPANFDWKTSRDVNVKFTTTDTRFVGLLHYVTIYSADPIEGGIKLAEGTFSPTMPFEASINTANTIQEYFVVKTAPDESRVMEKIKIVNNAITTNLTASNGIVKLNKTGGGPDCITGCSTVVNNPSGNLTYSSGVICLTGNVNIANLTLQNGVIVRVCGIGSINNLNMNGNSSSQFIVTGTGEINFTSTLPIDGNFINYGLVSTDPNRNFNINSTSTLTNYGIINAGKDFNPNGSSVIVNNGTINVANKLINSSGCDFTNNCKLIVYNDFQNNGLFKNYGYVKCFEETTIQGGSNNEFKQYNGAMITTQNIQVNGTITGFGTSSLIKVLGNSKGNAQGLVNGAQSYCDGNGIEGPWNASISGGAIQSCSLYVAITSCNPEGNGTIPSPPADTDADGVSDANDDYPNDPTKAFNNTYGVSTVAFEDLWPFRGDYDLNDVVVNYNYNVVTNASNNVVRVEATYLLRATGGSQNNGFAVQFPINRADVSAVTGATLEAGQTKAVLVIFNDMRTEMNMWNTVPSQAAVANITYNVAFNVTSTISLASFGLSGYNPFIWNGTSGFGRGYEIHLPGQLPTDLATTSLFGTGHDATNLTSGDTYVSTDGRFPWAINVPANYSYAIEKADINTAYTRFATWVSSNGAQFANWYSNTTGYRNTENIY